MDVGQGGGEEYTCKPVGARFIAPQGGVGWQACIRLDVGPSSPPWGAINLAPLALS
jgi:hypothetical protein